LSAQGNPVGFDRPAPVRARRIPYEDVLRKGAEDFVAHSTDGTERL